MATILYSGGTLTGEPMQGIIMQIYEQLFLESFEMPKKKVVISQDNVVSHNDQRDKENPLQWKTAKIGLLTAVLILVAAIITFVTPRGNYLFHKVFGNSIENTKNTELVKKDEVATPLAQLPESPVTIDEVYKTIKNDALTDLQKSEFKKKHNGRIVRWTGYVASVAPISSHRDDGGFFLIFRPESQREKSFPDLSIATFPQSAKADLIDLNEKDWVEIQGRLDIMDSDTASLKESKLIKWKKHENMNEEK